MSKYVEHTRGILLLALMSFIPGCVPAFAGCDPILPVVLPTGGSPNVTTIVLDWDVPTATDHGFNGGVIYLPSGDGRFPIVAVGPGFGQRSEHVHHWGLLLAENGYATVAVNPWRGTDTVLPRADQLLAGIDYVALRSEVAHRIDHSRQAVMGHSFGGIASLQAGVLRPSLKAVVANAAQLWGEVDHRVLSVPTALLSCEGDEPTTGSAERVFDSLPRQTEAVYIVIETDQGHDCGLYGEPVMDRAVLNWLDHYVQGSPDVPGCPPLEDEDYREVVKVLDGC